MAQQLFFSRDSKIYMHFGNKIWDLPVLDGFSFSQATNSSEITLAEMEGSAGVSRRGRRQFNDSLAPAEWSFATYVRPFKAAGTAVARDGSSDAVALTHSVEEALWAMFLGGKSYAEDHQAFQAAVPASEVVTAIVAGNSYVITSLGDTSQSDWNSITGVSTTQAVGFTFIAAAAGTGTGTVEKVVNVPTALKSTFNADLSNSATLGTADIYFVLGDANRKVYKLKDCVVNEASLDFDIDGIASINWSGMSSEIVDMTARTITQAAIPAHNATVADSSVVSAPSTSHPGGDVWLDSDDGHRLHTILTVPGSGNTTVTTNVYEATNSTTNFIRNRLTQLSVIPTTQNPTGDGSNELESAYDLTLTGGNITMSNNVSFITPEEIGLVNIPIGHVTGTRSVSGSMTCYLSKDTSATDNSADLWEDLKSITSVVTNSFGLIFKIGGATSNTARLEVNMPTCHLEIPTHSIEDVISLETNFNALPSTIDGTNEVTLKYFPKV